MCTGCLEFIEMKHYRDLFCQNALYILCHLGSEHSLMSTHFLAVPWPTHSRPSLQSWSANQRSVFRSRDQYKPIRGHYSSRVTNQRPVLPGPSHSRGCRDHTGTRGCSVSGNTCGLGEMEICTEWGETLREMVQGTVLE